MKLTPKALTPGGLLSLIISALWSAGYVAQDSHHGHDHDKGVAGLEMKEHVLRAGSSGLQQIPKSFSGAGVSRITADQISGEIRSISGRLAPDPVDFNSGLPAFVGLVEKYIKGSGGAWLGVTWDDLELDQDALLFSKSEQFLKFNVRRKGLLVQDAGIDFRFKHGYLVQIINQSFAEAKEASAASLKNLDSHLPLPAGASGTADNGLRLRVRVDATGKAYELIRVRAYQIATPDGKTYQAQLNTADGNVIEYQSDERYYAARITGEVHKRWYIEPLETRPFAHLKIGSVYTGEDGTVEIPGDSAPVLNGLTGKYVKVKTLTGDPVNETAVLENDEWLLRLKKPGTDQSSHDKYIAQLMVYYHTNFISRYARSFIDHPWLDQPLTANANLGRSCNAHYTNNTINMYSAGSNCANTGLISDVILHEWGHALDDQTGGIADGAFSEGFGDIISMIISHNNQLGIGFRLPGHEPVRDLSPDKIYPQDAGGGVHSEGLIIGSTFWDLWTELLQRHGEERAAEIISGYAFKMILAARRYTDVYDALLVIDDDNGDLSDGSPNHCSLNKVFNLHGLAEESVACKLAAVESWNLQGDEDQDGVPEPGETLNLTVSVRNASPQTVENLTGSVTIEGNDGVTVSTDPLTWGPVEPGGSATSLTSAQISLSPELACGSSFTARLRLAADTREVFQSKLFNVGTLSGSLETLEAAGLPAPVRDQQTTTSVVQVDSGQWEATTAVLNARLKFDITHTYRGDLRVKLIAPDGTEKQVYAGSGSDDDVHFDEDVTELFAGMTGKGTWTLSVFDKANRDEGTLDSFLLTLTPATFICD